jgi:hypothetical protein
MHAQGPLILIDFGICFIYVFVVSDGIHHGPKYL